MPTLIVPPIPSHPCFLAPGPLTKRESIIVIKQSVISKIPLRNNEASNAVSAIDGGLVKLVWFPTTPPLSKEDGGWGGGETVDSAL